MNTVAETDTQAPTIEIPVTEGNLRHGHIYLREYLWFFPKTAIRQGGSGLVDVEPCTLDLWQFGPVETEIDAEKAIFRWRGWKKFFRLHNVAAGDSIVFSRVSRGRFSVSVKHVRLEGLTTEANKGQEVQSHQIRTASRSSRRCNDLSGDEWLRYSLSIWSGIRKSPEEYALKHPAMFPQMLCERLIITLLRRRGKHRILDPFMGSGSTVVAARSLGKVGIGLDISEQYAEMARKRLEAPALFQGKAPEYYIHIADARHLGEYIKPNSIDLCITSPPYWDILNQKRTADMKAIRNYGNLSDDLGTIADYQAFLDQLTEVFRQVLAALRPAAYCAVIVMDLRKKDRFFPFHSDLAARLTAVGFVLDDMIIWDRAQEYNNLRPLGYPSVFRVNKIHEFILIFRKPAG